MAARPSAPMQAILDRLAVEDAGQPDPTTLPPAEGRALAARGNRRWNRDLPTMASATDTSVSLGDREIACRILVPPAGTAGTILFIHGGGWAFCDLDTHERAASLLAIAAGAAVVTLDYRLAPEHPFPAGLGDCAAVWTALCHGTGAFAGLRGPFALAGDSAGANLALALMQDGTLPRAEAGLLFYGVYDADFNAPSYVECAEGPGLTRAKMMRYWNWYAPGDQRADPRLCPLRATDDALRSLPPLYLNAAEVDPLRSDSERLFARLMALGRQDRFRLHAGVVHGFMQMTLDLEEARQATTDAGEAFRRITGAR